MSCPQRAAAGWGGQLFGFGKRHQMFNACLSSEKCHEALDCSALYGISLMVALFLLFFLCKLNEEGTCELIEEEVSKCKWFFLLVFTQFATLVTEGSSVVTHKREILWLLMWELARQKVLEETCSSQPPQEDQWSYPLYLSCGESSAFTANVISSFAKGSLLFTKVHSKILELTS